MKAIRRITVFLLCALLVFSSALSVAGNDIAAPSAVLNAKTADAGDSAPSIVLSDARISVTAGAKFRMTAQAVNFDAPVSIAWSTGNSSIATVDNNGIVSGKSSGRTEIKATAMNGDTPVSATCTVNVSSRRIIPHIFLSMNYKYSNLGDYYYSNNDRTWQMPFGFIRLYDNASQIIGYQYDFARVVFTYGNKDWLIEFWKGQYGLFQLGGEIGVYTKYAVGFGDTPASQCAGRDDWLDMEMTLYHNMTDGTVQREFTRDYGKYWWCDGYKVGKLNKSKPAAELQMVTRITLKDEQMAIAFANGMKDCGFLQVGDREQLRDDTFCRDGSDVYFIWRNLTESQRLIPVVIDNGPGGALVSVLAVLRLPFEVIFNGLHALYNVIIH